MGRNERRHPNLHPGPLLATSLSVTSFSALPAAVRPSQLQPGPSSCSQTLPPAVRTSQLRSDPPSCSQTLPAGANSLQGFFIVSISDFTYYNFLALFTNQFCVVKSIKTFYDGCPFQIFIIKHPQLHPPLIFQFPPPPCLSVIICGFHYLQINHMFQLLELSTSSSHQDHF